MHLRQLFKEDPKRGERYTLEATGLLLDYSKNLDHRSLNTDTFESIGSGANRANRG